MLELGEQYYQEWMDTLLSTPEQQSQFKAMEEELDLWVQLVEARIEVGLTQAEIARKLGVSKAQIAHIEQSGFHICSLDFLQRYATAIGKKLQISLVSC